MEHMGDQTWGKQSPRHYKVCTLRLKGAFTGSMHTVYLCMITLLGCPVICFTLLYASFWWFVTPFSGASVGKVTKWSDLYSNNQCVHLVYNNTHTHTHIFPKAILQFYNYVVLFNSAAEIKTKPQALQYCFTLHNTVQSSINISCTRLDSETTQKVKPFLI